METITLAIAGMACGGCANTVRQALLALPGVAAAEVSHVEGKAEVQYDPAVITAHQLSAAIEKAGYRNV